MIELTAEQWQEFRGSRIGELIIGQLKTLRHSIQEQMGYGGCFDGSETSHATLEGTMINYAVNTGQIQAIDSILHPIIMDREGEDEA